MADKEHEPDILVFLTIEELEINLLAMEKGIQYQDVALTEARKLNESKTFSFSCQELIDSMISNRAKMIEVQEKLTKAQENYRARHGHNVQ